MRYAPKQATHASAGSAGRNDGHCEHDAEDEVQLGGALDAENEGFALVAAQDRAEVVKSERKGEPDGQRCEWQEMRQGKNRCRRVAAEQQGGMIDFPKLAAEAD